MSSVHNTHICLPQPIALLYILYGYSHSRQDYVSFLCRQRLHFFPGLLTACPKANSPPHSRLDLSWLVSVWIFPGLLAACHLERPYLLGAPASWLASCVPLGDTLSVWVRLFPGLLAACLWETHYLGLSGSFLAC